MSELESICDFRSASEPHAASRRVESTALRCLSLRCTLLDSRLPPAYSLPAPRHCLAYPCTNLLTFHLRYEDSEVEDEEGGEEEEDEEEDAAEGDEKEEPKGKPTHIQYSIRTPSLGGLVHTGYITHNSDISFLAAAPQTKKRKAEDVDTSKSKKSKKTNGEEEDDEEDEEAENEAPEEDDDEEEAADDADDNEPAVKTKVIKGSESKQAAEEEVDDEELEAEV